MRQLSLLEHRQGYLWQAYLFAQTLDYFYANFFRNFTAVLLTLPFLLNCLKKFTVFLTPALLVRETIILYIVAY